MIQDVDLTNFNAGEWSPRLKGRFDLAKYFNACSAVRNMVLMPQGGATARPGTMFVTKTSNQSTGEVLIPFIFSENQSYMLGFGDNYVSFYYDDATVLSGAVPYQIASPYARSDANALGFVQSFDTMFLFHRSHPPQSLTRTGAAAFNMAPMTFLDGPYEDTNGTQTFVTVSGRTGSITCTFTSTNGINAGAGFSAADIGRMLRIKLYSLWGWLLITAVNSTTQVVAAIQPQVSNGAWGALDGAPWAPNIDYPVGAVVSNGGNNYYAATAGLSAASGGPSGTSSGIVDGTVTWNYRNNVPGSTLTWALGRWSNGNGYPGRVMFWQNRLVMLGTNNEPNLVIGSVTGDFTNLAPTQADGTVTDSNSFVWLLSDDQENDILWVSPAGSAQAMQLGIGTAGGEDILQASATSQALTPTNVQHYRETYYGSAVNVRPARIGKSVLFANRTGRKVHEWTFTWQVNGYLGPDLAVLAEHITRPVPSPPDALGIVQMAYQQSPHSVLWAIRSDGALIAMTYLRDQDIVGWHQHPLGGQYYGGPPIVESLAVKPSSAGGYDELWLEVLRTIGGIPTRTIEVMTAYFEGVSPDQAWFVDCGLQSPLTYPAATVTPAGLTTITAPDRPPAFSGTGTIGASAPIFASSQVGGIIRLNGGKVKITGYLTTVNVTVQALEPLTSQAPAAANTWSLGLPAGTVSGLNHLNGETVAILGDGQVNTQQVVVGGMVALQSPATLITAGLPYTPLLLTMPFQPQRAAAASAHGKLKRVIDLYLRVHETVGGTFGVRQIDPMTFTETVQTEQIQQRRPADNMNQGLPLFSGVRKLPALGGFDREGTTMIMQTDPLPLTVLALTAKADVEEVPPE